VAADLDGVCARAATAIRGRGEGPAARSNKGSEGRNRAVMSDEHRWRTPNLRVPRRSCGAVRTHSSKCLSSMGSGAGHACGGTSVPLFTRSDLAAPGARAPSEQ
jgi:hypothetical protein